LRIAGGGVKLSGMHEPPPQFHVAKIIIGGRTIECSSAEIRRLLLEAKAIGEDESSAQRFSIGRLMLIKDACQLHCLGRHQRLVKNAIDRHDGGLVPGASSL
jgi:hypothetical protein